MKNNLLKKMFFVAIMLTGSVIFAQTVSGTISDANGPLPGANVVVQGTTNGVTADFDGNYTIEAASDAVLVVSFIGYVTQEIAVAGQSTINVTLSEDSSELDEVVVLGYSSQTRGDITGSVASVDLDEALKVPVANAAEALQGRVSGVTVVSNNQPGAAPNVNIRGFGTFTSGTGPLYIIDGVQTQDPNILSRINPNDIEQMNVLKDGAATIYGARASNGVIIVTTKSGSYNQEKTTLSLDIYTGTQSPQDGQDLLNAQQHGQMLWDSFLNDGATPDHPQYGNGASPVVPSQLNLDSVGNYTSASVNPNGTDWWDAITQSAPTQNISLSMAGGTESSKSFVSLGYLNREGVLKYTGYKRANIQINNEFKIGEKVRIGQHLNTAYDRNQFGNNLAVENAIRSSPLVPIYDDNGDWAGTYSNAAGLSNNENPLSLLSRAQDNYGKNFQTYGDIYLSWEIIDGLTAKTQLAGSWQAYDSRNFTPLNPEHGESRSVNNLVEQDQTFTSWTWTNTLQYTKTFGEDHNLNALIGIEAVENNSKGKQISRTDYFNEDPSFYLLSNGFGDPNVDWAYESQNSLYSYFITADYNYAGKYFVTATLRRDKSSKFYGDNKEDFFPAVSGGWLLSKENWYPEDAVVNRIKLKASYGELGNQDIPVNSPGLTTFQFNQDHANYIFNNGGAVSSGAFLNLPGNENLVWERSITSNIGIELGFLDNKITTEIEFYNITTDGLITQDNQAASSTSIDSNAPYVNLGEIQNTGIDWNVGYYNTWESGLSFGVDFNLSHYKNEVKSLIDGTPVVGPALTSWAGSYTRTEEGGEISAFYGRVIDGFDANGRWTYKDVDGDGDVDDDDRTTIGSPHPDFTFGLNLTAEYKGWDLSMFWNGSQGNEIYNHNKIFTDFPLFVNGNRSTRVLDSWTPTNTNATLPALSASVQGSELNSNSYFVEDGSFVRLKNLTVGYSLADDVVEKIGLSQVRFYAQGTNLITITDYNGVDPEVIGSGALNQGVDTRVYPISKVYTLGLNLKF